MTLSYIVLLVLAALATAKSPLTKKPKPDGNVNAKGPAPPCGQSPLPPLSAMSTFIVGGTTAKSGDIPWQVAVYKDSQLICGGSYMLTATNEVKVATAAHCIEPGSEPGIFAAKFGLHDSSFFTDGKKITAESVVLHPDYNNITLSHDVAIMSFDGLSYTALAKTYASPICLVSTDYTVNETAMVSGWGYTSEGGEMSQYLQYAYLRMVDYDSCNVQNGVLDTTMLCAIGKGKDACQGDSGGPLAVYRDNKWQLAGIVSWGLNCADENHPGVYADVYNMLTWIDANL